ncbi:hypothetical protein GGR56DRAFT_632239 [Xylariaceae sp. FL0804]|nr:hypothetical protein GGR56DRAFT_632239 [Xylariaceae sp. FL0804]
MGTARVLRPQRGLRWPGSCHMRRLGRRSARCHRVATRAQRGRGRARHSRVLTLRVLCGQSRSNPNPNPKLRDDSGAPRLPLSPATPYSWSHQASSHVSWSFLRRFVSVSLSSFSCFSFCFSPSPCLPRVFSVEAAEMSSALLWAAPSRFMSLAPVARSWSSLSSDSPRCRRTCACQGAKCFQKMLERCHAWKRPLYEGLSQRPGPARARSASRRWARSCAAARGGCRGAHRACASGYLSGETLHHQTRRYHTFRRTVSVVACV